MIKLKDERERPNDDRIAIKRRNSVTRARCFVRDAELKIGMPSFKLLNEV